MDNIARSVLQKKLESLKATYFQDALDKIFHTIFGSDFTQIKQKQDKGADGILNGDTIIAAYAPEKYSLSDFKVKIGDDFDKYKTNWQSTHPFWQVICNLELTTSMQKIVTELKADAKILCISGLVELIRKQSWTKRSLIFKSLDIPDNYLSNDILGTVIEDLIKLSDESSKSIPYEKPTFIEEKTTLNLEPENVELFLEEYEQHLAYFSALAHVVKDQSTKNIQALRSKIRTTYMSSSGSFSQKLKNMNDVLSGSKNNDEYYCLHLRIVLIYFFEQCLFGQKTSAELQT